jgi:ApbE superfamily uncharacterized protein (UPF0280 family)
VSAVQVEERFYRYVMGSPDLASFQVAEGQSDLWVAVDRESWSPHLPDRVRDLVRRVRGELESYIARDSSFLTSLQPVAVEADAPAIARAMAEAAARVGVGPMAAVAGAVADVVARDLLTDVREVIVENGGDVFLCTRKPRRVGLLAGTSPFSLRVGLLVPGDGAPVAVCTSAGRWGHSLSLGQADAAVAVAPSGALADAAATWLGNLVREAADLPRALERARQLPGLTGAVLVRDSCLAAWGDIVLTPL